MNFSGIKKANWIVATVLLATSGMLATSCSKDNNTTLEQKDDIDGTNLVLSVVGTDESQNSNDINKKGAASNIATKLKVQSFSDVDVVSSIDNNIPLKGIRGISDNISQSSNSSAQAAASSKGLRAAVLAPGVTYRLYLFSADGSQLVSSSQFSVDQPTPGTIAVTPGQTYKWYALSYNDATAIDDISISNTSINLPENKDILYTSGDITIPSTPGADVALAITFKHKFSRIAIELNSMGVFGNMNSGNVSVSGLALKTGAIDVKTGAITPKSTTFTPTINWASFTNVDAAYSDAKIAYVYTAGTDALSNIEVSAANLAITHSDGVDRTFGASAAIKVPFNLTPVLGQSHRLLANIVESPLTAQGSTVKWARSNLYHVAGHNPYRFFAENKQRADANSFFAYGATTPAKFIQSSERGDPCALVYPANLWRQSNHNDFVALTTGNDLLNGLLSSLGSLNVALLPDAPAGSTPGKTGAAFNYAGYTTTTGGGSAAFDDASNNLRFYYNGQLARLNALDPDFLTLNATLVQGLLGGSYGKQAALWASDAPGNILGLIELGTWGYMASTEKLGVRVAGITVAVPNSEYVKAKGSAELLSQVSALGLQVLSSSLKNVRCVRAL